MEIKVAGPGCSKCQYTIALIEKLAQAAGVAVDIVKVTSLDEIQRLGATSTPAVFIDGKPVHSGGIPSRQEVAGWFEGRSLGFLNQPTRHLFFTSKGGVGKTSLSTATALAGRQRYQNCFGNADGSDSGVASGGAARRPAPRQY